MQPFVFQNDFNPLYLINKIAITPSHGHSFAVTFSYTKKHPAHLAEMLKIYKFN
ncbi:hypothetical protein HMPREF9104_00056 [Lentilactobacillus kisonensis F0435]|uniref:Uncharacterized protein n=1 Tax=Lentilactobacillus kisonensis F0435 TaxID=797516 RepID=H1LBU6_9LACO|nr:hypothetical protein HMPREF9104_00056 [Lentilactobacillus kisonensis F0435]